MRFALSSLLVAVFALVLLPARPALAAPDTKWRQGLVLAKRGDCAKAIPVLQDAELAKHRPSTAYALAGCYDKTGELLRASEIYHALSEEKVTRAFTRDDKVAVWSSKKKAAQIDARIPTISFETAETYDALEVEIDGRPVQSPTDPQKVLPRAKITITARAKGRKEIQETVTLKEKERLVFKVRLEIGADKVASKPKTPDEKMGSTTWLGARFRALVIPKFLMNAFGEGGTTLFIPGGDLTLTTSLTDADVVFTAGYSSYRMGEVPFKLGGRPSTEYEILESDMQALTATVSIIWNIRMDSAGRFNFRIGGGIGVGWMFAGDLYRTQAHPLLGEPEDPASYVKCSGPNSPAGTFRYCNQLDKDADHYNGYAEPSWFSGGARPLVFPWLTIPQVGFSWRVTPRLTMDLDLGLTVSGALGAFGMRFGL